MLGGAIAVLVVIFIIVIRFVGFGSTKPYRAPTPDVEAAEPTTSRRVKFNMYNTERRYGKKSGNILGTKLVQSRVDSGST